MNDAQSFIKEKKKNEKKIRKVYREKRLNVD